MALQAKHKRFLIRRDEYYNVNNEKVTVGETKRCIEGGLIVDYGCFKKTKAEKEILKLAKLQAKIDDMRKK